MIKRAAAVDIGTNTVLMLIGEIDDNNNFHKILEKYSIARLGENTDNTKKISDTAVSRTVEILKSYSEVCKINEVEKIVAVGTSALRDSENSAEVVKILNDALKAEIKVISGEQEAALSFIGTVRDDKTSMVIDIGGGSTEMIIGNSEKILEKVSLQTGAVRLTERYFKDQYPPMYDRISEAKKDVIKQLKHFKIQTQYEKVYAVAGTATTIATTVLGLHDYEVEKAHGYILAKQDLFRIYDLFQSNSLDEIVSKLLVNRKRADLILAGTLILKNIVNYFNIDELVISAHGLRYGVLLDFFKNPEKW